MLPPPSIPDQPPRGPYRRRASRRLRPRRALSRPSSRPPRRGWPPWRSRPYLQLRCCPRPGGPPCWPPRRACPQPHPARRPMPQLRQRALWRGLGIPAIRPARKPPWRPLPNRRRRRKRRLRPLPRCRPGLRPRGPRCSPAPTRPARARPGPPPACRPRPPSDPRRTPWSRVRTVRPWSRRIRIARPRAARHAPRRRRT